VSSLYEVSSEEGPGVVKITLSRLDSNTGVITSVNPDDPVESRYDTLFISRSIGNFEWESPAVTLLNGLGYSQKACIQTVREYDEDGLYRVLHKSTPLKPSEVNVSFSTASLN